MASPLNETAWLLAAGAAALGFIFGRLSAGGGGGDREVRRMQAQEQSRQALASLSPNRQAEIDQLVRDKRVIEAIKLMRETSGLGLKESKDAIDARRREIT